MKADVPRTSGCREIPELQTSSSLLALEPSCAEIGDIATWHATVAALKQRNALAPARIAAYEQLLSDGRAGDLIARIQRDAYTPAPPQRLDLNKSHGSRRTVYLFDVADELTMRVTNAVLQPIVDPLLQNGCHSFRRGRGAKSAFAHLLGTGDTASQWVVHLDIADFFNSIDPGLLLGDLPPAVTGNRPAMRVVTSTLSGLAVRDGGRVLPHAARGVLAGSPLAPLLSNLALRRLDDTLEASGFRWARYSDDIVVLGSREETAAAEQLIREHLAAARLCVNEAKTTHTPPGEAWDFLGLACDNGEITLSRNTARKLAMRAKRRARNLLRFRESGGTDARGVCRLFARSLNRRLYGLGSHGSDFSWAAWFFPALTSTERLAELDGIVQAEIRYAASGSRRARAHKLVPYPMLRDAGYLPLVAAYHTSRERGFNADRFLAAADAADAPITDGALG